MVEEVGAGAVRFFMLSRTPDSELEFDFVKAVEQSKDNPVFYVQYAHARCYSTFRKAKDMFPDFDINSLDLAQVDMSGDSNRRFVIDPALWSLLGDVSGLSVLDAGCGNGYLTRLLATKDAKTVGVDHSRTFVEYCKKVEY